MKYEEIVKNIYQMREELFNSESFFKDLELDILAQINFQFFISNSIVPTTICIEPHLKYSQDLFEYASVKIFTQLQLPHKFTQHLSNLYYFIM